jgi:peptidoglycan/xylan/chitin deacetylase (PgdA/CDA1 family)
MKSEPDCRRVERTAGCVALQGGTHNFARAVDKPPLRSVPAKVAGAKKWCRSSFLEFTVLPCGSRCVLSYNDRGWSRRRDARPTTPPVPSRGEWWHAELGIDSSGTNRWKGGNLGAVSKSGRIAVLLGAMVALGVLVPIRGSAQPAASEKVASRGAERPDLEYREGGIVRGPTSVRSLAVVFTGHGYAEGGETILNELGKHKGKGSFFFTGDFLTNTSFKPLIQRIVKEGHYLGPHSDKHVLYCPWEGPKKTLVTHAEFEADLQSNLGKIERFGVPRPRIRYFLPPYEYYNQEIVDWSKAMGLTVVNFTPGTRSNADYTGEADKNFVSTRTIFDSIVAREKKDTNGLNGFLLLVHIGSGPGRTDKFPARFGELLDYLADKGYQFVRVDELLEPKVSKTYPRRMNGSLVTDASRGGGWGHDLPG